LMPSKSTRHCKTRAEPEEVEEEPMTMVRVQEQ
jgi:hypothetical protein